MTAPRPSTAVLLTRPGAGDLEVFLARRNPELRFFGGYWACPGGSVEPVDEAGGGDDEALHLRCAARELFEEVGVLVEGLGRGLAAEQRAVLRAELLAGEGERGWRALLEARGTALGALRAFARLTTPAFALRRFRTRFVHASLPAGEEPAVCGRELVEGRFAPAGAWLDEWRRGEHLVAPPVLFLLELLAARELEDFLVEAERASAASEAGDVHAIQNVPGVRMAPFHTDTVPPATTTNTYVVGEGRLFVIDPAPADPLEQERLERTLLRWTAEGRTIAGVVATHHHPDHVGAVARVARRFSVPVYGHPLTLARLPEAPRDARALHDGDALELGRAPDGSEGWRLVAHHTPGHDRGHLAFVESRYRAAIVGDLASTLSTIVIDPPEGHMATYLASVARVRALGIGVLHPAHGPAHPDGGALLGALLEHRRARERKLRGALALGAADEGDLLARVYDDVTDERLLPLAARSLAAGLEKLAEEGRVRRDAAGRWFAAQD